MPIRGATLHHQIEKNGARLHLAMQTRIHAHGIDAAPSEQEQALLEERKALKQARAERQAQAALPHAKAPKLVRTTSHPVAKAPKAPKAPKADKAPKDAKSAKGAKAHVTRSEKHAQKAAALDAARRATKKSAKT